MDFEVFGVLRALWIVSGGVIGRGKIILITLVGLYGHNPVFSNADRIFDSVKLLFQEALKQDQNILLERETMPLLLYKTLLILLEYVVANGWNNETSRG